MLPIIISDKEPPAYIYNECKSRFGADMSKGIVFTHGDTIHTAFPLPDDLLAHETVHVRQQTNIEGGPQVWWRKYLDDPEFRLEQEIEAYQAQYKWVEKHTKDRNRKTRMLHFYALSLSGPMYGNLIDHKTAKLLITNKNKI